MRGPGHSSDWSFAKYFTRECHLELEGYANAWDIFDTCESLRNTLAYSAIKIDF